MERVSSFVGLTPFDWSQFHIQAHSNTKYQKSAIHDEEIELSPDTLARLEAAIAKYGTKYWDAVQVEGTMGCRPVGI